MAQAADQSTHYPQAGSTQTPQPGSTDPAARDTPQIALRPRKPREAIPELGKVIDQYGTVTIYETNKNMPLYYSNAPPEKSSYGNLKPLLMDDNLEEVMLVEESKGVIVYHKEWGMCFTNVYLTNEESMDVVKRIARYVGKEVDRIHPLLDGRLPDGSRVNATVIPASPEGPTLTIRKFRKDPFTIIDLINFGTLDTRAAAFLWMAVEGLQYKAANVLVSGGTGSGKTTTLNVLAMFIPKDLRVITIEDTAELQFEHEHWIRLEAVPPSPDVEEVSIDVLCKNTLRMRPDRLVVGEVRGKEAKTMFTAMNTGHDGTLGTVHANTAQETITRLTSSPMNVSPAMLTGLDLIVMQTRMSINGKPARRITEIAEVGGLEEDRPRLNHLFRWNGATKRLEPTGTPSKLREKISNAAGITLEEFDRIVANREEILRYMVKNSFRTKEQVASFIQSYYLNVRKAVPGIRLIDHYAGVQIFHDGSRGVSNYRVTHPLFDPTFGKLTSLISDPNLEEIMCNDETHPVKIYHRAHDMCDTDIYLSNAELTPIIQQLGKFVGKRIDAYHPLLDGRLPDGSRINATLPPASPNGPTLTIRKFRKDPFTIVDLIKFNTMDIDIATSLWMWVEGLGQKPSNILIAGGSSCGKTTTLNVLGMFIPAFERLVTIEDTLEIQLRHDHLVRLESITADMDTGEGAVSMDDLLKNCPRMRPDRILVGEVRGGEAVTMFNAMNTGVDGFLGTVHANTAQETITRLTSPPMEVPVVMLKDLDLIVMQQRMMINGKAKRRITEIAEMAGLEKNKPRLNTIYTWDPKNDRMLATGIPNKLRERICGIAGITLNEYEQIRATRRDIIQYMIDKDVRDSNAVCEIIQNYYDGFHEKMKG
jgi:Flp pilus assembly CpaF family ATPase